MLPHLQSRLLGSAKGLVEASLSSPRLLTYARSQRRTDVLILAYHNVVPMGETATGDRSLHLPQEEFARQLDCLQRTHEVVPLSTIFDPPAGSRPRAAITFDDAYEGAVTTGVAELSARGMPATIFVAPDFVGGGSFWWDLIADPTRGSVPEEHRNHCLRELKGRTAEIVMWAEENSIELNAIPGHQRVTSEAELGTATAGGGITLAVHTWSHPNLTALSESEVGDELTRSRDWLAERFTAFIPWVSYPYGLATPRVCQIAREVGFDAALRVDGGWCRPRKEENRHALPRLNIPAGISLRGFNLRAAGVTELLG